ncbi:MULTISPECIES: glycosyltransferase family 2 protein [unclassified Curtobacterium]|uniref:glycosyltransferase family 2 protein n=1 Tax=unclassified Curtobacterium TaxID=257496 RepID=UPI000DA9A36E|nr:MULTISPECIES: glycosyltransferase family 2 protein [unclassified Curtobacterium]PZE23062.1 glycosyltransferase family 2 protein [Curtobacterium sp. MCBD17_028]PZF56211.1 glycosyltransferase family 2 protein [Curtobacterium sp. MCBD17_034]PZF57078.1 glycosyltransferase family 2 protein [Curtobacterium sp. MCBD17_013]PZM32883.1 glycosyltransferase family 2 protein [Curtobacterium sp. MCBD17_031]WIB62756.1 glycosyltransferase family 2 protein [Curtobacterium sp. MCBD17_040]
MNPNLPAPLNAPIPAEPTISIVIPARNEAKNLALVLPTLPPVHEVILVDGDSIDGTAATAKAVMPDIRVVSQTRRGKGNALACGFAVATGDVIVMFDADGSADPTEIPRFVEALVAGADVAKGSRFRLGGGSEDITGVRRVGNAGLNVLTNLLLGTDYTDLCYGFNAFRRSVLPHLDLPAVDAAPAADGRMLWGDGFEIETIINCRIAFADLAVVEVPSVERLRIHGESNLNAVSDGFRVLKTILDERTRGLAARRVARTAARTRSVHPAGGAIAVPARQRRDVA